MYPVVETGCFLFKKGHSLRKRALQGVDPKCCWGDPVTKIARSVPGIHSPYVAMSIDHAEQLFNFHVFEVLAEASDGVLMVSEHWDFEQSVHVVYARFMIFGLLAIPNSQ